MLKIAGITFFSRALAAIITFGIVIVISRNLGAAERGVCSLYLLIVTLSAVVSEMAGGGTTAFLLNKFNPHFLHRLQLVWSIVPSILVPASFFIFGAISVYEFLFMIGACWMHSAFQMQQHLFLGLQKFLIFNVFQVLVPTLTLLIFIFLVRAVPNRFSYFYSTIISWFSIFFAGYYLILFRKVKAEYHQKWNWGSLLEIFKIGGTNQLGHLVSLFNARLLFFILPAVQLGVWSNTLNIAEGVFLIAGSLGQILYSMFTRKDYREAPNESFFRKAFVTNLLLTLLFGIVISILPDDFWTFIFGPGFMGMQQFLRLLLAGLIAQSVYLLLSYRLSAEGLFSKNLYALLYGAGINILVSVVFIFFGKYSVQTGIIGLSLGWTVSAIAALFFVERNIPDAFEFKFRKK